MTEKTYGRTVRFEPLPPVRDQLERSKDLVEAGEALLRGGAALAAAARSLGAAGNLLLACVEIDPATLAEAQAAAAAIREAADTLDRLFERLKAGGLQ